MKKVISTKTTCEKYFAGWVEVTSVTSIYGEKLSLRAEYQPGQLYTGYSPYDIPKAITRPLAIWLARQSWAVDGYLVVEGDQLILVKPDHSFWYPQPDTKCVIAKIA